ncbi:MAG TPA: sigma-54 dependent transcriptional regulator [Alkalispirochaeta sp.]|nr:sigma-54 dependent transcriptional regulator [Alkalispirochaeta sp.]
MEIAVVDDEKWPAEDLARFVESLGHTAHVFHSGADALEGIKNRALELVISDVTMPGMSGLELVQQAFDLRLPVQFVLISGVEEVAQSINAMELGVLDFFTKPIDIAKLAEVIQEYDHRRRNETFAFSETGEAGLFSQQMRNLYRKLRKLQDFPQIPVLLQGETGTGKEVLARYLHHQNEHVTGAFIALNCSALTKELFEAELFGYEGGAFTGAERAGKPGKIALAAGGTLFLDEITELAPDLQAKLLRVIQERTYFPVGGTTERTVDTRFVCATNEHIEALVQRKAFREDLFYRLNVCQATIPPLRERTEEIGPLVWMFLRSFADEFDHEFTTVAPEALTLMERYPWPGNIREMRNVLTNIAIFEEGRELTVGHIRRHLTAPGSDGHDWESPRPAHAETVTLPVSEPFVLPDAPFDLEAFTRRVVAAAMEQFQGNKTQVAAHLGLTRTQLYGRYRGVSDLADAEE